MCQVLSDIRIIVKTTLKKLNVHFVKTNQAPF